MNYNEFEEYVNEYRGLNEDGVWEYGGIDDKHQMIVKGFCYIKILKNTIGKSTHCRDINGVIAYTGDIVLPSPNSNVPSTYKLIKYIPEYGKFVMVSNSPDEDKYYDLTQGMFEIVGNIHQNGQLLNKTTPQQCNKTHVNSAWNFFNTI